MLHLLQAVLILLTVACVYFSFGAARNESAKRRGVSDLHGPLCIVRFDLLRGVTIAQLGVLTASLICILVDLPHEIFPYLFWSGWSSGWLVFLYSQWKLKRTGKHVLANGEACKGGACR